MAQTVKRLPTMRETRVPSLGQEDLLEEAVATHSRTLAWKIPRTKEPGSLSPWGHKESDTTERLALSPSYWTDSGEDKPPGGWASGREMTEQELQVWGAGGRGGTRAPHRGQSHLFRPLVPQTLVWSESEKVAQSCLTLCNPIDGSQPGSSIHEIFHERTLEWVAIFFSRRSSWPRDGTQVSCTAGRHFTV